MYGVHVTAGSSESPGSQHGHPLTEQSENVMDILFKGEWEKYIHPGSNPLMDPIDFIGHMHMHS